MNLLSELKRRNVFRVGLFYVVSAWLVVQIAETVLPVFEVPEAVIRGLILILIIGFVPALVFAWVFEMTPEGLKRDKDVAVSAETKKQTRHKLNWATLVAAVVAIGLLVADRMVPEKAAGPIVAATPETAATPAGDEPRPASDSEPDPASIAVLPFDDLSPQGDQQYFADGIAEEILNVLVRVDGLEVASRTSAFRFRDQDDLGIPGIARELDVRHVLEGSVRKAGDTIRVTAQLIDARSDKHLWSETYDRSLSLENVFAIQDEIASAIVAALRSSIELPATNEVHVSTSTDSLDAYELYLEARGLFLGRRQLDETDTLLERATSIDPEFARAWELRAALNMLMPSYGYVEYSPTEFERRGQEFAQRALGLDPNSSLALAVQANIRMGRNQEMRFSAPFAEIIADLESALTIDPRNASAMNWLGLAHLWLGNLDTALALFQRCNRVETRYGPCMENQYDTLASMGRYDEALQVFEKALNQGIGTAYWTNFALLAHFDEEIAFKLLAFQPRWLDGFEQVDELYAAFRNPGAEHSDLADALKRHLEREQAEELEGSTWLSGLVIPAGFFDVLPGGLHLWSPEYARYRRSPQFHELMNESGAVAYWREYGWPDACRPIGEEDFECD